MLILLLVGVGPTELILIGLGIALLFGATRIPLLMKGMGQGIKEFKGALKDDEPPAGAPTAPPPGGPGVNPTTSDEQTS
ncbi:MAG: twin-arginine translocase TatA/TatE family subunit [bacterium]|nr:twin-arginine translocase TatA/TatE family subunit [bacterium]